ncbi:MAG: phenylalanine--tRNA ligase subunit beta [Lachnospiraceae bacterium]|nr:phenylalanine--tRNA ligase subunit beta [Lachnospiraceae bacterium]MDY5742915.1 phenylalanine--tRNA ligase subunit beta [Lachnospiraceae bacterium]
MNTSLSWIKSYVPDLKATAQEYTDAMTLSGTKVEGYEILDKNLEKIVVAQITAIEKHPNADKLIVCQVDIGNEPVQIVTGARNVAVGDKIPVVLDGGRVAASHGNGGENGIKIKKGKLRGVESCGMMCSIEELGQTRELFPEAPEYGIYIFPKDTPVGADAVEVLGLHDVVFEYEVTSNRVDCYSVVGIAREAAATFGCEFKPPVITATGNTEDVHDMISVEVQAPELCPRFTARVVKNIKIEPSPKWLRQHLVSCGIRPINNIVDITNYVMEEYGQPMHAYNLDAIADRKIIVKRAGEGETFVTLDGKERKLDENVLMIADGQRYIGIAGIMGGENSMITDDAKHLLFEAACFDGTNVRLSSKRVGLRTDASGKFEKGLDPNLAETAISRACQLIELLGAGEVVGGMVDIYLEKRVEKRVPFSAERINHLLGTELSAEQMLAYLERIEIVYDEAAGELVIPTFRQDLELEADIAEEVARFFGYDNIPTTLPGGSAASGRLSAKLEIEKLISETAMAHGFNQAMTYSFESPKVFDKLLIGEASDYRRVVTISNPLGQDYSIMRTLPLDGILTSLATNYNRRNKNVRLFELANTYLPKQLPVTELPEERMQFVLAAYGETDFFVMKGVVENVLDKLGIGTDLAYVTEDKPSFLHPGRCARILCGGKRIGYLGELHPQAAKNYDIGERAYVAVLDMPAVTEFIDMDTKYRGIPKFPAVNRDLSMVVPKSLPVGEIEAVYKNGIPYMESYRLFDVYEGEQVGADKKSVAYALTFRSAEGTLTEEQIQASMQKILAGLEALGISLRA